MRPNQEGFIMPEIKQKTCIDCGLCAKRCPQNSTERLLHSTGQTIAARLKDDTILYKSASGGAFAGIALHALRDGWVVFGVVYDENLKAHHTKAESVEELQAMLSSKYVQSDTEHTYSEVKRLLKEGHKVVYSGTACQIGGLRSFLGKMSCDNLLTIDLICHGVASPLLFSKYIETLKQKHHVDSIEEYDFRDKCGGWGLGYKYKYKYKYNSGNFTSKNSGIAL